METVILIICSVFVIFLGFKSMKTKGFSGRRSIDPDKYVLIYWGFLVLAIIFGLILEQYRK